MSPNFLKPKKQARLKAARKQLPKSKRMFFVALMATVALTFQARMLDQQATGQAAQAAAQMAAY